MKRAAKAGRHSGEQRPKAGDAGHPVLILGGGRGGTALLDIFIDDPNVCVVGIADLDGDAPGLRLAAEYGISTFTDVESALAAAQNFPDCIVFNLTHDDKLAELAEQALGQRNVTSGVAAKLVWEIVTHLRAVKQELEKSHSFLSHMAHHDQLTGLPNRFQFRDRLEQCLAMAARRRQVLAVMLLDLDGFKQVNDTFGHKAGDQLLQEVSARLRATLRGDDTVARVGGDEFNFILNDIDNRDNAAVVGNKIIAALAPPFVLDGNVCQIGGSIGVGLFPQCGADAETLLLCADAAMYRAKRGGKNRCVICESPDGEAVCYRKVLARPEQAASGIP